MVWQLDVEPGAQMVTLTDGILMTPFTPLPTVIGTVFAAVAAIGCWVGLGGSEPPFSDARRIVAGAAAVSAATARGEGCQQRDGQRGAAAGL